MISEYSQTKAERSKHTPMAKMNLLKLPSLPNNNADNIEFQ